MSGVIFIPINTNPSGRNNKIIFIITKNTAIVTKQKTKMAIKNINLKKFSIDFVDIFLFIINYLFLANFSYFIYILANFSDNIPSHHT
jgi:hypothetical protein